MSIAIDYLPTTPKEAAHWWYDFGLNVAPMDRDTKRARLRWQEWLDKLKDAGHAAIDAEWRKGDLVCAITDSRIIVFDADTPESLAALHNLEEYFDVVPNLVAKTKRGEHHFFRKSPTDTYATCCGFSSQQHPQNIDIRTGRTLTDGRGIIALPPGDNRYLLMDEAGHIDELVEVDQAFIDAVYRHNNSEPPRPYQAPTVNMHSRAPAELDELTEILSYLDPSCSYSDWLSVLMGVHNHTQGSLDGLALVNDWSSRGDSYSGFEEIEYKWNTFTSSGHTTFATVCKMAASNGANLSEIARQFRNSGNSTCSNSNYLPANHLPPSNEWPEPQSIAAKVPPEPYPLEALPNTIRAAVEEVANFVKAPLPLVATTAVAALSLAGQAYVDVKRAEGLQGPSGIFALTIADSGERKTTCDSFFTSAIRKYQAEQAEALKPELERYNAALDAWKAEREGLLTAIKLASKNGKPTNKLRDELADLQAQQPKAPRMPRMILGDETPESLAWTLAKGWPSAGIVSSEAGTVLGSHGMGKDSVMRNLALNNILWDGKELTIGRKTSESFTVNGARLTVALQIQEATLKEFLSKSGNLARGTGFLARFLLAWPDSTQGKRVFSEAPQSWPKLDAFNHRITNLLNKPAPMDDNGALSPAVMSFSPEAKAEWINYHNEIESELATGRELESVRDVASKTAENAARLAALFELFENPGSPHIGLTAFRGASSIAAWHLNESLRFFGELALPTELADAERIDKWLIEYSKQESASSVAKNYTRQYGPIRDGSRLDSALEVLTSLDRTSITKDGRRILINVNPSLLV